MALTYTHNENLGSPCPDFQLQAIDGKNYTLSDFKAPVLIFAFICNHCPFVRLLEDRIIALSKKLNPNDAEFIGICSNDATNYPEDSPEALKKRAKEKNYPFVYLLDESQEVAKEFQALATPDFFIYNKKRNLVYRGRFDDSVKDESKVENKELEEAVLLALKDKDIPKQQPSIGCSIKWKNT